MITITRCPVCGAVPSFTVKGKVYLEKYRGVMRKVAAEYFKLCNEPDPKEAVSFCPNCRAVYRARFFDESEIKNIYGSLYQSLEENLLGDPDFGYDNQKFLDGCSKKMLNAVRGIEGKYNFKASNIFDVGGRDGFRLKGLAAEGYNCKVFDPISCDVCDKRISKERKWAHEIGSQEKADIIFLCNVLEHSIDPHGMLKSCYEHLKEGGFLYIELPSDIETVFDWIFFNVWRKANLTIDNTHFVFYSKKSIIYLLESAGLSLSQCGFSALSFTKVNVLDIIGRKIRPETSAASGWISFDYDILSSGHLPRLFSRMMKKAAGSAKVVFKK